MDFNSIRDYIAKGNTLRAINTLSENLESIHASRQKEILMISSRFNTLRSKSISGIISDREFRLERNKIDKSILDFCEIAEVSSSVEKNKIKEQLEKINRISK